MLNFAAAPTPTEGVPFLDLLRQRSARPGASDLEAVNLSRRLWAWLSEYDVLVDEVGQAGQTEPPSIPQFTARWGGAERTNYGIAAEVRALLGDEPAAVMAELWTALQAQQRPGRMAKLATVRVIPASAPGPS